MTASWSYLVCGNIITVITANQVVTLCLTLRFYVSLMGGMSSSSLVKYANMIVVIENKLK